MPEELYPSKGNPTKNPPPGAHPQQVTAAKDTVSQKKQSFGKRLLDTFMMEKPAVIGQYLLDNVVVPALKKMAIDSICGAANRFFGTSGTKAPPANTWTSQSSVYQGRPSGYYTTPANNARYDRANFYNHILEGSRFRYKETADEIIQRAMDWIHEYGFITVSDFNYILPQALQYNVAHTDVNWGWYNLLPGCVQPLDDGCWTIDMPPAQARR